MSLTLENFDVLDDLIAMRWSDGQENFLRLPLLRQNCPCAVCSGEPDGLRPGPLPLDVAEIAPGMSTLKRIDSVGGYALRPVWGDGHNTGIYSFALLRELGSSHEE
ncbi:MAG: DUF971 domain-containing protein [Verrucomicrobiales bacterium]